ncbi:MAG TPA: FlgD immunoglobulin-like domain containing protein, partial [Prolixibacteraceae bacterium]|nr:FlgD immunoglobulin-like domain containing protein [Prolixibacteraceae bacterium]
LAKLFQDSYKVVDAMRIKSPAVGAGIYLDALAINVGNKPVALAANGVGLYSLCIADAMYKKTGDAVNWDANAEAKALQTINEWIRLKDTPGAVNANGLFHRYLDPKDGSWVWVTEHSTIDNAIMAAGFLFCRNYFNKNEEIVSKTTTLLNSMDFTAAIPPSGNQMYMILDDNGAGSALTSPFNEYLVLAWFAKNSNSSFPRYERAQTYWDNVYSDPTKGVIPKYNYPAGNPLISGGSGYAQPSFHVQFAYYYCNYFSNNTSYMTYFANQLKADQTWWQNTTSQQTAFGLGAGEIPGGGYSADAVNHNPERIVSPHIMAGFSPVYPDVWRDLISLYGSGTGSAVYKIPGTNIEFLWRYKYTAPAQRASYVQAVDFSTMVYGLAALPEFLGTDFFKTYNDFNFTTSVSSLDLDGGKEQLEIYPNPFSGHTTVRFELENKAKVKIEIYAENGQVIKQLVDRQMNAGRHSVKWNGKDESNAAVSPGTYLCRLSVDNRALQSKQMLIVK